MAQQKPSPYIQNDQSAATAVLQNYIKNKNSLSTASDDLVPITPSSSGVTEQSTGKESGDIRPNILRNYASFSPIIELKVTSPANFNAMVARQKYHATEWDTICRSGGTGKTIHYFSPDLYIDDIELTTLCGMSQENRGSNVTNIDFNITEPNGMDFLENLYDYTTDFLKEQNYLQLPYMLVISFVGYKDSGEFEIIPGVTKYIPLHLSQIDIKLNNTGSVYKVKAWAFNELATTTLFGFIPSTNELNPQTKLEDGSFTFGYDDTIGANDGGAHRLDNGQRGVGLQAFTDGLTNYIGQLQTHLLTTDPPQLGVIDHYKIVYADIAVPGTGGKIAEANVLPHLFPVANNAQMGAPAAVGNKINFAIMGQNILQNVADPQTGKTSNGSVTYDPSGKITFNAGSSILDVLNTLIINSSYITNQINDFNQKANEISLLAGALTQEAAEKDPTIQAKIKVLENTPFNWFKISPQTQLGPWDAIRKCYSVIVTYVVRPYLIYNSLNPYAFNGKPNERITKKYDYIFTGKNTEILSWDINFAVAYLAFNQFNKDQKAPASGASMPANLQNPASTGASRTFATLISDTTPLNAGVNIMPTASSTKASSSVGAVSPEMAIAGDIASTIYAPGELLQLELQINGDPDFIKQDGLFINNVNYTSFEPYLANSNMPTGIMSFDTGEIYSEVTFKLPQDLNQSTGIVNAVKHNNAKKVKRNIFSGLYRVLQVNNKISKAHFTQNITLVKFSPKELKIGPSYTPLAPVAISAGASGTSNNSNQESRNGDFE